jgi:hypothetical protein
LVRGNAEGTIRNTFTRFALSGVAPGNPAGFKPNKATAMNENEMREVSTDELRTVEGGFNITVWYIRDILTKMGEAPGEQEKFIVSLSPSQKP